MYRYFVELPKIISMLDKSMHKDKYPLITSSLLNRP